MKYVILWVTLMALFSETRCQPKQSEFENFISKFEEAYPPFNVSELVGGINMEQGGKMISEAEFREFLVLGDEELWEYNPSYAYKAFSKFDYHDYHIILYNRSYYPENMMDEKSEYVLNVYNKEHLVSSMPIQGSYGDDFSFFSFLDENFNIIITEETFSQEDNSDESNISTKVNTFHINPETGIIELLGGNN